MTKTQVEVITSVQRRRRWSRAEKERIVAAALEPGAVASEVAREAGIHTSQLFRWRQQLCKRTPVPAAFNPVAVAPELLRLVWSARDAVSSGQMRSPNWKGQLPREKLTGADHSGRAKVDRWVIPLAPECLNIGAKISLASKVRCNDSEPREEIHARPLPGYVDDALAAVDAVTSLSMAQAPQIVRPPARIRGKPNFSGIWQANNAMKTRRFIR
jgi:transposase-like protein